MNLEIQINADILSAMKNKNADKLRALRGLKGAIGLKKTEKGIGGDITNDEVLAIIQKQIKSRKEVAVTYMQQNRIDLYDIEMDEVAIFNDYLPVQLTESDVLPIIQSVVKEVGATSMKEMGKVMNHPSIVGLNGKIEKGIISKLIKNQFT